MRLKAAFVFCLLAGLAVTAAGLAQEGHPLTGVWYGDWGPTAAQRNHLTIQMNWDGKNVTGIVNPGPDSFPLKVATLDSSKLKPTEKTTRAIPPISSRTANSKTSVRTIARLQALGTTAQRKRISSFE